METIPTNKKPVRAFFVEITDCYGGEPNYSWVRRYKVNAVSERGALQKANRQHGYRWRKYNDDGDSVSYRSYSDATCCFITEWADDYHENYMHVEAL